MLERLIMKGPVLRNRFKFLFAKFLFAWIVLLGGCGTAEPVRPMTVSDSGKVMEMWHTYTHCVETEEIESLRLDALRLNHAVQQPRPGHEFTVSPTSEPKQKKVPLPPIRVSVDPSAMAAACTLRVGQVAQEAGLPHVAEEMYRTVLVQFPHPRYEFYSAQARKGLELLNTENVPQQGPVCADDTVGCRKDDRLSTTPDPA